MGVFPADISAQGHLADHLFYLATYLTGAAFAIVLGTLVYFLIRYRERPGHTAWYTHGNSKNAIRLTIWLALAVFFFIDVNLAYNDHFAFEALWGSPPNPQESLRVQVMPEQFAWNIRYAGADGQFGTGDDVTTINQLHVPVNRPVRVELRSIDVIHSFFLPNLRIKQDALPGMTTSLYFVATRTGQYEIACAELCGHQHYEMRGFLTVEEPEKFEKWLQEYAREYGADAQLWRQWDQEVKSR